MVVLHVLGQCLIRTAVATVTPRADTGFALGMYLIAKRGKRVARADLLAHFWPGAQRNAGPHKLSVALHKLRCKGFPIHTDDALCVWLPREVATIDIEHVRDIAPHEIADRDLSILPGYVPSMLPSYSDWVDEWRTEVRTRLISELHSSIERAEANSDWRLAMAIADQILRADADDEHALRTTARAAERLRQQRHSSLRATRRESLEVVPPPSSGSRVLSERPARPTWAPPSAGFAPAQDTVLVGRDGDMEILADALAHASSGTGSCVLLSGPAGIGKSRVVREVVARARRVGAAVAFTSCQEYDAHRPLSAFVDAVPAVRELPGAAGAAPEMTPYLDRLTGQVATPADLRAEFSDADYVVGRVRHAVFDLFDAVAEEQPFVFVVENVQWLDTQSWALLREMATWAVKRSFLIVLTSREPWSVDAHGPPSNAFTLRTLNPLDAESTAVHARDYAHAIGHVPSNDFVDWCVAAAEGNPYILEELVNHWAVTGETFRTPPSLTVLLDTRLARLAPNSLYVLQTCATLGRNSTLARLERSLKQTHITLFMALEELGHAGMLTTAHDDTAAGNGLVGCRHDAIAQAALGMLSAPGLAMMHRSAGAVLEAELENTESASLRWDCAEHLFASGNAVRAVELGQSCVAHLLDIGLAHDAAEGCRKTLRYCVRARDKESVLQTLCHALYLQRSWTDFFAAVEEFRALRNATASGEHDELELLARDAAWHAHRDWDAVLEASVNCAMEINASPLHRVRAGIIALKVATNMGEAATMHRVHQALQVPLADPAVPEAERLTIRMIYHAICDDPAVGADSARKLLVATAAAPPLHQLGVAMNCAGALWRCGYTVDGDDVYRTCLVKAEGLQAYAVTAEICLQLFIRYLDAGEMETAQVWVHRLIALRRPDSELWQQRPLRLALARIEVWRGNLESADHFLSAEGQPLWEDSVTAFQAAALATKLLVEMARGTDIAVVEPLVLKLRSASDLLRAMGAQDFETWSLHQALRYIGDDDGASQLITQYASKERRDVSPLPVHIAAELERIQRLATD